MEDGELPEDLVFLIAHRGVCLAEAALGPVLQVEAFHHAHAAGEFLEDKDEAVDALAPFLIAGPEPAGEHHDDASQQGQKGEAGEGESEVDLRETGDVEDGGEDHIERLHRDAVDEEPDRLRVAGDAVDERAGRVRVEEAEAHALHLRVDGGAQLDDNAALAEAVCHRRGEVGEPRADRGGGEDPDPEGEEDEVRRPFRRRVPAEGEFRGERIGLHLFAQVIDRDPDPAETRQPEGEEGHIEDHETKSAPAISHRQADEAQEQITLSRRRAGRRRGGGHGGRRGEGGEIAGRARVM